MLAFLLLVSFLALLPRGSLALLDEPIITFRKSSAALSIKDATIFCSQDDAVGVHIAARNLASDLEQITAEARDVVLLDRFDHAEGVSTSLLPSAIIAGSVDSPMIQHLVSAGKINVSEIEGKWESFMSTVVDEPLPFVRRALVIVGSDRRGAIYGIYTLSEQAGQSPYVNPNPVNMTKREIGLRHILVCSLLLRFSTDHISSYHFFADVPTKKHDQIYALPGTVIQKEPAVKYRGLFINDEEPALNGWWATYKNKTRHPLDAEFYAHVFDLLLRLKANFLWPAMWKSSTPPPGNIFFTDDPLNQQLAQDYGIVVSTSHHEPMQRATNEWNITEKGPWDWSRNRENITQFMEEGIARAGSNESYFTLGMRGLGDEAMDAEDAVKVLNEVFQVQRTIIKRYYGSESAVPRKFRHGPWLR